MTTATPTSSGASMHALIERLYPICRSMTGEGVRQTLAIVGEYIPLQVHEVPSGTDVLDWRVPPEWTIRDAWIKNAAGERVVDFRQLNLHVVGNSMPVRGRFSMDELRPHLFTLPDQPDWVPYRTAYHTEDWGFCLSQNQLEGLTEPEYEVSIDSTLGPGHLTYGELVVPGRTDEEVLFSTHVCHPSLCNDNLSGIVIATFLAEWLAGRPLRYTYRFVFAPGTIGAITWLARNADAAARIRHGLTLSNLGDRHSFTYKRTERGDAEIDRVVAHVIGHLDEASEVIDFFPYGYDERQYNSPGYRLPVGALMRSQFGQYPEYHSSADNLTFVSSTHLEEALNALQAVVGVIEGDRTYRSLAPYGEPQLGRRGLYKAVHGSGRLKDSQFAMLWVLNQSDGKHSLLDIAERSGLPFATVQKVASTLEEHKLLEEVAEATE